MGTENKSSGYILAVVNNKGGVGKTTLTINLGHSLAARGYKTLAVDLDNQCNTTHKLTDRSIRDLTIYEMLDSDKYHNIDQFIYQTQYKNLYCMPNHPDVSGVEMGLINAHKFFLLRDILREPLKKEFAYTLIDCPPNLLFFVYSALFMSDFVIVPILSTSPDSLDGLSTVLEKINQIQNAENPDLRFLRLLINNVDRRTNMGKILMDKLQKTLGKDYIFQTTIPTCTHFQKAEYLGKSVLGYAPTGSGAKAYRSLAKEVESLVPVDSSQLNN